jgi:hypothetical protein
MHLALAHVPGLRLTNEVGGGGQVEESREAKVLGDDRGEVDALGAAVGLEFKGWDRDGQRRELAGANDAQLLVP